MAKKVATTNSVKQDSVELISLTLGNRDSGSRININFPQGNFKGEMEWEEGPEGSPEDLAEFLKRAIEIRDAVVQVLLGKVK